MAEIVMKNAAVHVNGVDLSDHVRSATITYTAELLDKTAMGSSGRKRIAGLKDWTASVEFNQDFAASEVDATHFSLVGASSFVLSIWANSTTAGAGNVLYTGSALLESYAPLTNAVGELGTVTIPYQAAVGVLTRTT